MKEKRFQPGDLFDELPPPQRSDTTAIVRIGGLESSEMSPDQKKFNRLAKKVEKLRLDIEAQARSFDAILGYWAVELAPRRAAMAAELEALAMAVDGKATGYKFGVRQKEKTGDFILDLLDQASSLATLSEEAESAYDRWFEAVKDEETEDDDSAEIEFIGEMLNSNFGVELPEEVIRQGPEAVSAFISEAQAAKRASRGSGGKKGAARMEREEREKAAREMEMKSLRSLYLSLAKVLHPDAERDESAKAEKEAVMKRVTAAYEAQDLHSLLKIEMEWIADESSHLGTVSEKTLKNYLVTLESQARDLQDELGALRFSDRYGHINAYLGGDFEKARFLIDRDKGSVEMSIEEIKQAESAFAAVTLKKEFLELIQGFYH